MSEPQIVRKSEFAALRGVSAGRVSQWIAEGKISGMALVGAGRSAQINVAVATQQLRASLDISQRFGLNGVSTRLGEETPVALPPPPLGEAPPPVVDSVETRIKAEKLRQTVLATRRLEEQDRASRGVYVKADEARAATVRAISEAVKAFDGALADFASALAAKFQLPERDALHLLRSEFRRIRQRATDRFAEQAAAEPEFVEDGDDYDTPQP